MSSSRILLVLLGVALFGSAQRACAQAPLYLVNDSTTVGSISFRYADTKTLEPIVIEEQIALKAPGYFETGWRKPILGWLPLFGGGGPYPFSPIELQKDVVRIERVYNRNGFPQPSVDYLARLDSARNTVAVLFNIVEGPPLLIDTVRFAGPGGQPAIEQLDAEVQADWRRFRGQITSGQGERLTDLRLLQIQDEALNWLRQRGYAFADVSGEARVDSTALGAEVRIKMNAGPRARYGEIVVRGVESVDETVVLRELPFRPGEPFRQSELTDGQRQVFSLNLFQLAAVDIADTLSNRDDAVVGVRVLVRETDPRLLTGFGGYSSAGGATASAQWTHRNFWGGARSFTASLLAQSGIGAVGQDPQIEYEARLALRQPYFFNRYFSAGIQPFARYQDDIIERSTQYGVSGNVLYERGPLHNVSISPTFTARTVGADSVSLVDPSTLLPGSAFSITRTLVNLAAAFGRVDDPLRPRSGFILRPSARITTPAFSDVEFGGLGGTAVAFVPFGRRAGITARVSGGYLIPFGGTDPANGFDYIGLRDALYFAGGTNDVRGWGSNLLGPKFIDFVSVRDTSFAGFLGEFTGDDADAEATYYRTKYGVRYRPVGTEAKMSVSLQANLPLPLGPQWGASVFADAGRVWSPAEGLYQLFGDNAPASTPDLPQLVQLFRDDRATLRYGGGGGLQYLTPVGYLSVEVGVKLNPSYLDLRDPIEVFRAADIENLVPGPPDFTTVQEQWIKRLQFHLSFGQRF